MDGKTFIKIINERNKIRSELNKKLKNKSFSICEEEYYLIEESWDNDLIENFNEYKNKNGNFNNENYDYNKLIPEDEPEFINDIESIINCVENKIQLKLISRKSIESIYDKEFLNDYNLIKYYYGNNKLIIEYINDEENKSLLLIDPLNKKKIEERVFIISTEDIEDEEKINLFKNLINKDIDIIKDDIIPFKIYIKFNKLTNKINELNKNIKDKEKKINKLSDELQKQKKFKNQYISINQRQTEYRENLEKTLNNEINKYKEILKEKEKEIQELKKREDMIIKKEKEINKKIAFLEDKENSIEKENNEIKKRKEEFQKDLQENIKLKKENNNLIKRNKELEEEIKKKESKLKSIKNKNKMEEYSFPTLIGLNNIGATCFMNSTLQCLSQTSHLTKYFLNEENENRIRNNNLALKKQNLQLSPIYLELIKKLWNKNGPKSFSPNNFMNVIEKMNPLFKQGQAGDSKDFIIFILEQLHKELKRPIKLNNNNNMNVPLNQYDKDNAFNYFFNDFKKECSIISDVFFGFTETTNECLYCKNIYNSKGLLRPICYNYGIFNCLIFPLEEVKNLKNNNMQNNNYMNNNNIVSIYDCFYYNQKNELFTGDNRNYCNICKQLFDSIYTSKIFISPNVLVLILNRGKDNKFNVKLTFYENIDISSFVLRKDTPKIIYNLYGVITHIGQSGPNAHFVASCKSPIDHKWYRYNDSMVNSIEKIQKEVIDFGTPYILFYQKSQIGEVKLENHTL